MTEVFFYILDDAGPDSRARLAWRVAERAMRAGRRVYVHTGGEQQASAIDQHFWAHPPAGFLPHALAGEASASDTPVVIGHGDDPGEHQDVLLNLGEQVPDFFSRFSRVAEMVTGDENERRVARSRWKFYRDQGFPVHDHRLQG